MDRLPDGLAGKERNKDGSASGDVVDVEDPKDGSATGEQRPLPVRRDLIDDLWGDSEDFGKNQCG